MTVKEKILALLAEVDNLLVDADCDGEPLTELDCYSDVTNALGTLTQAIDYYVD